VALSDGDIVIFEGPLLHEADLRGADAVDEELGVVEGAEELAHEGIGVPDFLEQRAVGDDLGETREADLVMAGIHVAQFDLGIGGDFACLVIEPQVGDIDREAIGFDGRDRAKSRLITVDRGKHRQAIGLDDAQGEQADVHGVDGFGNGFGHGRNGLTA